MEYNSHVLGNEFHAHLINEDEIEKLESVKK